MGLFSSLFKKSFSFFSVRRTVTATTQSRIVREWKNIQHNLNSSSPAQLKQALISADKCLDNALRDIVEGNNMGQRLKNAKDLYDWDLYNKIWKAHKMRNSLVHEAGYEPTHYMLKDSVAILKEGIEKVGVKI